MLDFSPVIRDFMVIFLVMAAIIGGALWLICWLGDRSGPRQD